MSVLNDIVAIVEWHRGLPSDFSNLNLMIHKRRQLTGYNFTLATEVRDARTDWRNAFATYEAVKNQKRVLNESKGTTKADWIARANTEEELRDWVDKENYFKGLEYVHGAVKETLSEMNQTIAHLRDEMKQEKFFSA